jgi:parallel beta-helix repeat protein
MLKHRLCPPPNRLTLAIFFAALLAVIAWPPGPVGAQSPGHLAITRVGISSAIARAGDSLTAAIVVRNQSDETSPATSGTLHIAAAANATVDPGGAAAAFAIGPLEPEATTEIIVPFTVPQAPPGIQYVIVQADPSQALPEGSERGNRAAARFRIAVPDLTVLSVAVAPRLTRAGDPVGVRVTVRNDARVPAASSQIAIFVTSAVVPLRGLTPLATAEVPALGPQASADVVVPLTLPMLTPGTYYAGARIDDAVTGNNRRFRHFEVTTPEVSIARLAVTPSMASPGQEASAGVQFVNRGRVPSHPTTADVFLAGSKSADRGGALAMTQVALGSIRPGRTARYTVPLTIPLVEPGPYYVITQLDASSATGALDVMTVSTAATVAPRSQPRKAVKVRVARPAARPDLAVTSITTSPSAVLPGATVLATGSVVNQGTDSAPSTTLRFWLAGDPSADPTSTGSGAVLLGSSPVPALATAEPMSFAVSLTVPSAAEAGQRYIQVLADADAVVAESSESNNLAHVSLLIQAPEPPSASPSSPPPPPSGAVFYTATDGHDGNPGTEAAPFRTVAKGVSRLSPGATLYVKAGTYAEALIHTIPPGESWSRPVTVAAYPGHAVTLQPPAGAPGVLRFVGPQAYIVVHGFVLDAANVQFDAVKVTASSSGGPAHHIRISHCEVKNAPAQGILTTLGAHSNEFIGLDVHDNGQTDFDHGFYVATDGNLVADSDIHRNAGWGIHVYNQTAGQSASFNVIRGNRVFDNARIGARGPGILLSSGQGNHAYNNVVYANKWGIEVYNSTDALVAFNTVFGNGSTLPGIYLQSSAVNTTVRNNISYQNTGGNFHGSGASGLVSDHNLFGTDPLFVNPGAFDLRLQAGSPAIDAGTPLALITTDFDGTERPQYGGVDIGAFEWH